MRHRRGNPVGSHGRSRARAKARGRNLPPITGCSVRADPHLLRPAAQACFGGARPGPTPARPSALAPPHPHAASAGARSSSAVSLRSCALPPSSPSSPPVRCPGSRLRRSRRLLASKPLRPRWRSRGTTASLHPAGGGGPAFAATATFWRVKCRDVAISTRTKAPEGLESCRRGGAS
jgi:hypothetical protein